MFTSHIVYFGPYENIWPQLFKWRFTLSDPCFLGQITSVGFVSQPFKYSYDHRDIILYALSVGATTTDEKHSLNQLFELSEGFAPLPSFAVLPGFAGLVGLVTGAVPGLQVDLTKVTLSPFLAIMMCDRG